MMKSSFLAKCLLLTIAAIASPAFAENNVEAGIAVTKKYACASCHGEGFNKPTQPTYPKLAGQHADYLKHALIAYQRGDGANGRNNAIMGATAKQMSAQEIADVAAYLHSLQGSLVLQK
jgi:cytochrome c553